MCHSRGQHLCPPIAPNHTAKGVTSTEAATCATVTCALPSTLLNDAATVAETFDSASVTSLPAASLAFAVKFADSPNDARRTVEGVTEGT
jgi:hypothetical protein